jgi:hypothetical protein
MDVVAYVVSTGVFLVGYVAGVSRSQTNAAVGRAFAVALAGMVIANMFIFGLGQSLAGVIAFSACPLIGASLAMLLLSRVRVSEFWWGAIAFGGGVVGIGFSLPAGLFFACMTGNCV